MIISVELENFKKHKSLKVPFTDGMNILRGPNFAGKSTILSAIAFARYGVKAVAGDTSELITIGEKNCKVTLTETFGKDEIVIVRGSSNAKAFKNGKEVSSGNGATSDWVSQYFGATLKEYNLHTYAQQMETSAVLTSGASVLQAQVESLADVDIVDKVIKKGQEKSIYLKGSIDAKGVLQDKEEIVLEKNSAEKVLKALEAKTNKLSKSIKTTEKDLRNSQAFLKSVQADNQYRETTLAEILDTSTLLDSESLALTELRLSYAKRPKNLSKMAEEAERERSELDYKIANGFLKAKKIEAMLSYISDGEAWITEYTEKLPELEKQEALCLALESSITEIEVDLSLVIDHKSKAKRDLDIAEEKLSSGSCPECLRPFDNSKKITNDLASEIKQLKSTLASKTKAATQLGTKLDTLHRELTSASEGDNITEVNQELKDISKTCETYQKNIKDLKASGALSFDEIEVLTANQAAVVDKAFSLGQQSSDKVAEKTLISKSEETIQALKAKLSELKELEIPKYVAEDATTLHIADLTSATHELGGELLVANTELLQGRRELSRISLDLTHLLEEEKLLEALNKKLKLVLDLLNYLRKSRQRFMATTWSAILGRASEIARTTTAGSDSPITQMTKKPSGGFYYEENGAVFSVKSASGCQKEIMGVSLRLALCDLFYGSGSYLMLDESSSQMNEENAAAMAGTLAATGKQILCVTHRSSEQLVADNVIFIGGEQ